MDEPQDSPAEIKEETIRCAMCQQFVPALQTRTISGRPLCLGCLSEWYGEDEDED
jgi:formylmethanofuran dehydrogenase subunit E